MGRLVHQIPKGGVIHLFGVSKRTSSTADYHKKQSSESLVFKVEKELVAIPESERVEAEHSSKSRTSLVKRVRTIGRCSEVRHPNLTLLGDYLGHQERLVAK